MRRLTAALSLVLICLTASPLTAAASPYSAACSGINKSNQSAVCQTDASSDSIAANGPKELILKITDIISYISGALAVILIIVGSIRFITAGSDMSTGSRTDTDVEDARRTIVSALTGLAVIVLARTIIFYVIKRL